MSSPRDARITCTFLSGFTGSAHCTILYGTDPTYTNLPYSAESAETGTAGDTVSVVLRERLNSSTVYYYTVTAATEDFSVVVLGTFTTPEYRTYVLLYLLTLLTTNDDNIELWPMLQSVLKIGSVLTERVGRGEVGGCHLEG